MSSDTLPGSRELATTHVKKTATCTTGSSVPSERGFSKAGELASARRNALKPKRAVFEQEFVTMYLHIFYYFRMHLILFKVSIPSRFQA